jgi:NodT family efflux transporter outer membrane factor (OMF) lipoprotein
MRRAALLLAASLLSGCVMGPNYRTPQPLPAAAGPLLYVPDGVATPNASSDEWWRLYDDAALDRLVRRALAANTDLAAAEADFDAARAVLSETRAARLPTTSVEVGGAYGRDTVSTQIGDAVGKPAKNVWLFENGFDTSYEVDLFGRVRRAVEASRADAQAAAAARDAVRIAIVAETVRDYVSACAAARQVDVAKAASALALQERDIVDRQLDAGGATRFDLARQETVLSQTRATIPEFEGERRAALFALAAILGTTPDQVPAEAEACRTIPQIHQLVPVGDGGALIARRPDVRLAERRLAAASARIGVAEADLLPRITIGASVESATPNLSSLASHAATSFGLGPLVSWSFPNLVAAKARVRLAKAEDRAAVADYDGAILTALKEVEQSLARYSSALERERELELAERQAQTAYDLARDRHDAGSISQLDMLEAEQTLIGARIAVAAAEANRTDLLVSLFKALGGGWARAA